MWLPDFLPVANDRTNPRAYALMRQSLDSNGTYQRLQQVATQTTTLTFDKLFSRAGTPAPSITQLAAYIWDLRFRIDTDLNDSSSGFADGNAPTAPADHSNPSVRYYNASGNLYPPQLPAYIEIRFKALSDQAARRLEGSSVVSPSTWTDNDPTTLHQQIIQPNFQQFILRVPLTGPIPQ